MIKWEYDITFHSLEELGIDQAQFLHDQVISCDPEGHCFFSDFLRPYMDAFQKILNERGFNGWELVQVGFHRGSLVCFWKRQLND